MSALRLLPVLPATTSFVVALPDVDAVVLPDLDAASYETTA
jgi:hypothetical protein